jgi:hypothetical protein
MILISKAVLDFGERWVQPSTSITLIVYGKKGQTDTIPFAVQVELKLPVVWGQLKSNHQSER